MVRSYGLWPGDTLRIQAKALGPSAVPAYPQAVGRHIVVSIGRIGGTRDVDGHDTGTGPIGLTTLARLE